MTQQQSVLTFAWLVAIEAVREFFAPVSAVVRWCRSRQLRTSSRPPSGQPPADLQSLLSDVKKLERDIERHRNFPIAKTEAFAVQCLSYATQFKQRSKHVDLQQVLLALDSIVVRNESSIACYVSFNLGESFFERRDLEAAEEYFRRALDLGYRHRVLEVAGAASSRLALVCYFGHQIERAEGYSREAVRLFEETGDRDSLLHASVNLASILAERGSKTELAVALAKATETSADLSVFLTPQAK